MENVLTIEVLERDYGEHECVLVDLACCPSEVERQRNEEVHLVKEYFERQKDHPLLYMTEIYTRGVCKEAATRPYPFCVFGAEDDHERMLARQGLFLSYYSSFIFFFPFLASELPFLLFSLYMSSFTLLLNSRAAAKRGK